VEREALAAASVAAGGAMAGPPSIPTGSGRLAERIAASRHRDFVGREAELALFRHAMLASEPPFSVLHVHGPGGIGKTALLREFARFGEQAGRTCAWIDGRDLDPSPPAFMRALGHALGLAENAPPLAGLDGDGRVVLLIDTYETLAALDAWLREVFLPQFPAGACVVLAGRNPPTAAWHSDPGWRALAHVIALRNLSPDESSVYLQARGIPEARHRDVLAFTHGHPLALALVGEVLARSGAHAPFTPQHAPDVVQVLLERFVRQVPSARHRDALQVCAHVRVTTETLLAEVLGEEHATDLFAWLRGLSFVEQGPQGLFPHDLAREVLDVDLRWRNPVEYQELHRRVRRFVVRALQNANTREQRQRAAFDLLYLHRGSPIVQPIHDWNALTAGYAEPARAADLPAILAMVRHHEGADAAAIAAHWAARQLAGFVVCRDANGEIDGFVATLRLGEAHAEELTTDPAISAAWQFANRFGPLRPGEEIVYQRFQMGRETYQAPSPAMNLMAMTSVVHWLTTPRLAWSFLNVAEPERWHPVFTYLNMRRSPEAEFGVGGRRYAVYTHDWREEPPALWLEVMSEREMETDLVVEAIETRRPAPVIVLSEPEFAAAVRQALRDFTRPDALSANPLLRSRLVREREGASNTETLRTLIRDAAAQLRDTPRDEKLYRALQRTYLEPAATQELAAERLGLPFSTYRRHLGRGVARVTASLWRQELHGSADVTVAPPS
jgi:hypothetical protein